MKSDTSRVHLFKPLVQCVVLCMVTACGGSAPSDELATQTWLAANHPGGYLVSRGHELLSFEKVNGVAGEQDGVRFYEYTFKAQFLCKADDYFLMVIPNPGACKGGEQFQILGELHFIETENGWQAR
jgi:hypothetical protein